MIGEGFGIGFALVSSDVGVVAAVAGGAPEFPPEGTAGSSGAVGIGPVALVRAVD